MLPRSAQYAYLDHLVREVLVRTERLISMVNYISVVLLCALAGPLLTTCFKLNANRKKK